MPTVSTSAGRTPRSARSIAAVRSTASAVRSVPLRRSSRSSSNRSATRAVSAGLPVAVISLPRTWMSALNSRSITCSSSSPDPSRLTIERSAGITIFTWDRDSLWPSTRSGSPWDGSPGWPLPPEPLLPRRSLSEVRRSSFRISVNSSSIRRSPRPGGPPPEDRALHAIRHGYPGGQVRERPPSTWAGQRRTGIQAHQYRRASQIQAESGESFVTGLVTGVTRATHRTRIRIIGGACRQWIAAADAPE